eukprot:CAMPEP_0171621002 /NCGR_PEP_ID=MMETSP0990-20121206/16336_1 /TAXON_ID=483369 /ORGANISM="non described non described, Strain CCMP2098" /LENGTH=159 /DNA_ID=CAMNT_0012186421 /DNA_START=149 /DNA_END=629 /DNA_ORIENTATION=+
MSATHPELNRNTTKKKGACQGRMEPPHSSFSLRKPIVFVVWVFEEAREERHRPRDGGGGGEAQNAPHGQAPVLELLELDGVEVSFRLFRNLLVEVVDVVVRAEAAVEHIVANELEVLAGHVKELENAHKAKNLTQRTSGEAEERVDGRLRAQALKRDAF